MLHHTCSVIPLYNSMVKQNVLWIPLNVLCSKQSGRELLLRRYWIYFSFCTKLHQMVLWKTECLQQKHSSDKNSGPHWLPYTHRCDGQEFESDNDLPYRHHKRACLCLVCEALMQGENKYAPALWYLCVLTTCDQHALPTIKQGHSEGCPWGIEINNEEGVVGEQFERRLDTV